MSWFNMQILTPDGTFDQQWSRLEHRKVRAGITASAPWIWRARSVLEPPTMARSTL